MTTAQHTAGPWRVFDSFTNPEIVTDRPTAFETESLVQFKGQSNAKANAQLMAAAPELLAALRKAEHHLSRFYALAIQSEGDIRWMLAHDAIMEARAAIDKTEGGAA
jgi:hypothetical protein